MLAYIDDARVRLSLEEPRRVLLLLLVGGHGCRSAPLFFHSIDEMSSARAKAKRARESDVARKTKASASRAFDHDELLLPQGQNGLLEVEDELERTWRVTQSEIQQSAATGAADKAFSLDLNQFGPYVVDYTRNGRCVVLVHARERVFAQLT